MFFFVWFQIHAVSDMYKLLQEYNSSLQLYNSKLQGDLDEAHETIKRGEKERTGIVENIGNLKGQFKALQDQLAASKVIFDSAFIRLMIVSKLLVRSEHNPRVVLLGISR